MAPPPDAPLPPLTPSLILFYAKVAQNTHYALYAAFAFMIWDHILTFADEVQYVWKARWTVIKILFLFNRYVSAIILGGNVWIESGMVEGLTNKFCQGWALLTLSTELLCLAFVSFAILFRLHAIWGGSRNMLIALLAVWLLAFLGSILVWFRVVYRSRRFIFHEENFNLCFAVIPNFWLQWLPDALLHIIMFSILVLRAVSTPRSSQTRMLGIMYRDGVLYYSITLAVLLSGVLIWRFANYAWIGLPLYAGWIVCQIATSRLLLNIKFCQQIFQMQSKREAGREKDVNTYGRAKYMGHSNYSSYSGYSDYGKRPLSSLPILPTLTMMDSTAVISIVATNSSESHGGHEDVDCYEENNTYALETMKSATYSVPSSTATLIKPQSGNEDFGVSSGNKGFDSLTYYGTYGTYGANRGFVGPIAISRSPELAPTRTSSCSIINRQNLSYNQDQGPGPGPAHMPTQMKSRTRSQSLQEQVSEHQMRQWMRSADYGTRTKRGIETSSTNYSGWWWWLSGKRNGLRLPGGERREVVVSVDAAEVERWEPGDIGPGVKESHLGRYDHWL